ncbi:MAG: FecR domain-containing protein [Candidatus Omnitrophica bacterium]|nr:FecR domain-containing protein [Candidatus Omnitrophota bacterium]HPM42940.1 FecR domain-containing protein [Candidatus Omnitrophota bacterium]
MKIFRVLAIVLCAFFLASAAIAADTARVAKVLELEGTVEVKTASGPWMPASVDMELRQGDAIRTQANSFAVLNVDGMAQTATVEVKQNSNMELAQLVADKEAMTQSTLLDLALGEVLIKAKKLHSEKSRFEVKTPTSIVGVRGTTFSVTVEAQQEGE